MSSLLYKKNIEEIKDGVDQVQLINETNSPLVHTHLRVLDFQPNSSYSEQLEKWEAAVVVLEGKVTVEVEDQVFEDIGTRETVFEQIPTDSVYVTNDTSFEVKAKDKAKVLIAYAPSEEKKENRLIPASENTVEHRGKYANKRKVHNILDDQSPYANNLIVVEVYTEAGNWSSYPPHKHDQDNLPEESFLEEIYYHQIDPGQGFVFQRVYTDDRDLDETMSVYNEDCVIVPKGYHPVGVPDGYTSYYLNVMAGPHKVWRFNNEKDHEWILERD